MSYCIKRSLSPLSESLLLDVLFEQGFALELISCELTDIENGLKEVSETRYKQLVSLYHELNQLEA
ncbi:antirepressor AbbA [Bacillus salitolerans]|uniref:Antirepressor AbbA n=1 Tax=Bacillus salitolerans TaxID=1437434 RepID=A0ABW4LKJ3_9BACI